MAKAHKPDEVRVLLNRKVGKGYLDLVLPVGTGNLNPNKTKVMVGEDGVMLDRAEAEKLVMMDPVNFKIEGREELSDTTRRVVKDEEEAPKRRPIPDNMDNLTYTQVQDLAKEYDIKANQNRLKLIDELNAVRDGKGGVVELDDDEQEALEAEMFDD